MLKHHRDKRWQETYALRCLMIFAVVFMVTTDFSDFVAAEQKKGAMSPGFYLRENMVIVRDTAIVFKGNNRRWPDSSSELTSGFAGSPKGLLNPFTKQHELPLFEQTESEDNRSKIDIGQVCYFSKAPDSFVIVGRSASGILRLNEHDTLPMNEERKPQ